MEYDNLLYEKMELLNDDFIKNIYGENLLRFLGKSNRTYTKKIPLVGSD